MRLLAFLICGLLAFCSAAHAQIASSISAVTKVSDESRHTEETDVSDSVRESILSKIDRAVVQEMERAWKAAGCGTSNQEAVLLLFRMADGSIRARAEGATNEHRAFNFNWDPAAVAIVHTHPNSAAPQPSRGDQKLAHKLGVPIFTLSYRGMFVYDPRTRKATQIERDLDWLSFSKKESLK